jgi:hypothetical protein
MRPLGLLLRIKPTPDRANARTAVGLIRRFSLIVARDSRPWPRSRIALPRDAADQLPQGSLSDPFSSSSASAILSSVNGFSPFS